MTEARARIRIMTDAGVISNPEWQGARITQMIHEAMIWTQAQLLRLGKNYWITSATATGVAGGTLEKVTGTKVSEAELATNINWDIPITSFSHSDYTYPAQPIELANWNFVCKNTVIKPSLTRPAFCQVGKDVYLFPAIISNPTYLYTRIPTAPTYDNDTNALDIPDQHIEIVIERVVMQIRQQLGDAQSKQLRMADIDSYLQKKYQLVPQETNRKVTQ